MLREDLVRLEIANQIQKIVSEADYYYDGESELTRNLLHYLEEHDCPCILKKLPEDEERRKDIIRLMVRFWATREALKCAEKLLE